MSNNSRFSIALAAVILFSMFSFISSANAAPMGGKGQNEAGMVWRLDLTKAQRDSISAKETAVRQETLPLRKSIRDLRIQLNTELSSDNPNKQKVDALVDQTSKNMAEIQKKEISFMLWIRDQLTPEQKQKLFSLMQSMQPTGMGSREPGNF